VVPPPGETGSPEADAGNPALLLVAAHAPRRYDTHTDSPVQISYGLMGEALCRTGAAIGCCTVGPAGRKRSMKPLSGREMRSGITILMSGSVVLVTAGILTDWWWLMGIGVWMLIAAGLLEMVYRP
jgi:hypothetical protein